MKTEFNGTGRHRAVMAIICLSLLTVLQTSSWGRGKPAGQQKEPDYIKGETLPGDEKGRNLNYHNLGPIGASGYIWANREGTRDTRMIKVKSVWKGGPAGSVLLTGDVILGVGDKTFSSDPRKALAEAITNAEKKENKGKLVLSVWRPETRWEPIVYKGKMKKKAIEKNLPTRKRVLIEPVKGKTQQVTLTLPIMGTYSATAPWNCEKTQTIVDSACNHLLDSGLKIRRNRAGAITIGSYDIPPMLKVLGLLATGEEKYLPTVRAYVRGVADTKKNADGGFNSWSMGYQTLLLTEYYLATKDAYVLPAINNVALQIARGASDVGTFSHGSAYSFTAHGRKWKFPSAYGAMNQCSITCALGLVLAQKCGVKNDEVDSVVRKAADFYRWYVDKGNIPYGDHPPGLRHDNNGANSQAAVLFDLLGDKEAATYYTRCTLASYKKREEGHTGHFFSWHWGALGAARGGEAAAQSFVANTQWFLELERRPGGLYTYQPQLNNEDHGKYTGWGTTGSRLLQHCLPRKQLYITGKGRSSVAPITGNDLKESVAAGTFEAKNLSTQELLKALGSWSPVVRREAAIELGERKDNVVDQMIAMLDSSERYRRYGAAEGLSYAGRGSEKAIEALVKKLQPDNDLTMRYYAVGAFRSRRTYIHTDNERGWRTYKNLLAKNKEAIKKAVPALLKLAANYEPEKDPMRKLHREVAITLFAGGRVSPYSGIFSGGKGTGQMDRKLLIPAIKSMLINPCSAARNEAGVIFPYLTKGDLEQLWGDIYYATKYQAPSGSMFADGVRASGLSLMANKGVEEGMLVGIDWVLAQRGWGQHKRKLSIPTLLKYGKALEAHTPEIEKALSGWPGKDCRYTKQDAEKFRKDLAKSFEKTARKLKSIKPYIEAAPDPLLEALKATP